MHYVKPTEYFQQRPIPGDISLANFHSPQLIDMALGCLTDEGFPITNGFQR